MGEKGSELAQRLAGEKSVKGRGEEAEGRGMGRGFNEKGGDESPGTGVECVSWTGRGEKDKQG